MDFYELEPMNYNLVLLYAWELLTFAQARALERRQKINR